jgi:hypothetical protein
MIKITLERDEKDTQFSYWIDRCTDLLSGLIKPGKHYTYFDMCQCIYDSRQDCIIKPYIIKP